MAIQPTRIASVDFAGGVNNLLRNFRAAQQQELQQKQLEATTDHRNRMFERLVANDAQGQENFETKLGVENQARQAAAAQAEAARQESLRRFQIQTGLRQQSINNSAANAAATRAQAEATRKATEAFRNRPNEGQSKAAGFARRTIRSHIELSKPENVQAAISYEQAAKAKVPIVGNSLLSKARRKYEQSKRNFINATLRRESGAAIQASEFDSADLQYFPQPGDDPETIRQKLQNREDTIQSLIESSGPLANKFSGFKSQLPAQQPTSQQVPGVQNGATATNPQTGEKIVFQNGQWVPAQ